MINGRLVVYIEASNGASFPFLEISKTKF